MNEYGAFRVVDISEGQPHSRVRYLGVQCTSCEAVVWEPLVAGHELQDIADECREHICPDVDA